MRNLKRGVAAAFVIGTLALLMGPEAAAGVLMMIAFFVGLVFGPAWLEDRALERRRRRLEARGIRLSDRARHSPRRAPAADGPGRPDGGAAIPLD